MHGELTCFLQIHGPPREQPALFPAHAIPHIIDHFLPAALRAPDPRHRQLRLVALEHRHRHHCAPHDGLLLFVAAAAAALIVGLEEAVPPRGSPLGRLHLDREVAARVDAVVPAVAVRDLRHVDGVEDGADPLPGVVAVQVFHVNELAAFCFGDVGEELIVVFIVDVGGGGAGGCG